MEFISVVQATSEYVNTNKEGLKILQDTRTQPFIPAMLKSSGLEWSGDINWTYRGTADNCFMVFKHKLESLCKVLNVIAEDAGPKAKCAQLLVGTKKDLQSSLLNPNEITAINWLVLDHDACAGDWTKIIELLTLCNIAFIAQESHSNVYTKVVGQKYHIFIPLDSPLKRPEHINWEETYAQEFSWIIGAIARMAGMETDFDHKIGKLDQIIYLSQRITPESQKPAILFKNGNAFNWVRFLGLTGYYSYKSLIPKAPNTLNKNFDAAKFTMNELIWSLDKTYPNISVKDHQLLSDTVGMSWKMLNYAYDLFEKVKK